jgi:hypothetical protein
MFPLLTSCNEFSWIPIEVPLDSSIRRLPTGEASNYKGHIWQYRSAVALAAMCTENKLFQIKARTVDMPKKTNFFVGITGLTSRSYDTEETE